MKRPIEVTPAMGTSVGKASAALATQMAPLLRGKPSPVQAGALADLVSIWVLQHVPLDGSNQDELRLDLLQTFMELVVRLIPVNERVIAEVEAEQQRRKQ